MSDIKNFNHPLVRELQAIGVLSEESTPQIIGDIGNDSSIKGVLRVNTEVFNGDASGAYQKLAQESVGVVSLFAWDGTSLFSAMTPTTEYVLDGTSFTFKDNFTGSRIVLTYTY